MIAEVLGQRWGVGEWGKDVEVGGVGGVPGGSWILISLLTAKQFQADHYLQEIIKTQKENME